MQPLLKKISEKAIELSDLEFTQEQTDRKWLGNEPATEAEIELAEKRLGVEFPPDFKTFLYISNGFSAPNNIEPTFEQVDQIDYLKNIDNFIIDAYSIDGLEPIGRALEKSILVAGIDQEQYFLLIPSDTTAGEYKYWKFSNWLPGEEEYENIETYFEEVLTFLNESLEDQDS